MTNVIADMTTTITKPVVNNNSPRRQQPVSRSIHYRVVTARGSAADIRGNMPPGSIVSLNRIVLFLMAC